MEIILDLAVIHPQEADEWVGKWPLILRQILKSTSGNSTNFSNILTNFSKKALVFFIIALKEVSKILAEAVSETRKQCAAEMKLIERTSHAQSELDQQQWRGTIVSTHY